MAFQYLDWTFHGLDRPEPGEQAEFRRVRVLQRFRWNGGLCQRIDRSRDRRGPYNAIVLDGEDSPKRVYILDHEVVEIVG